MNKKTLTFDDESLYNIFSENSYNIGSAFLQEYLNIKIRETDFSTVRDLTIKNFDLNSEEVPEFEFEFYQFICLEVIRLKKTPQDELIKEIKETIDDLKHIQKIRETHEVILESIEKDKGIEGKKYKLNFHRYYLNKIKRQEDEVIAFLRNDMLNSSFSNSRNIWNYDYRYSFRTGKMFYLHENTTEIFHKIYNVAIGEIETYCKMYENDKNKFFRKIRKVNPAKELVKNIKLLVKNNHLLNRRRIIINKLLKFYNKRNLDVFINLVPQQIEGLLYDLAIEIGISPESLKTSSITDKARFLYDKGDILKEFDFEYFAFIFPVVRNRIAHGKKIDNKINDLAFTLLFDLQTVTTFFNSTKFKYNKALSILELIHKDEKDISSLIQYVDLLGTKIDPFYKPKYSDKEIKELLRKEFKFEKIQKRVRRGTVLGVTIPAIAKKLIRMGINTEDCQLVMDNYKVNDIGQGPPVRIVKIVKP